MIHFHSLDRKLMIKEMFKISRDDPMSIHVYKHYDVPKTYINIWSYITSLSLISASYQRFILEFELDLGVPGFRHAAYVVLIYR